MSFLKNKKKRHKMKNFLIRALCKFIPNKEIKSKIKKNLLYGLQKGLKNHPESLIIDIATRCTQNCFFCWRAAFPELSKKRNTDKNFTNMPLPTFKKIIDDAIQYKSLTWFSICGPIGEPLIVPNINNYMDYVRKKNHFTDIIVNTNGMLIHKHNFAKLLNNFTHFQISVDSINPETYGKIHGDSKQLKIVLKNIKDLCNYKKTYGGKAKIIVRFTENEINKGEFNNFEKYFKDIVDSIKHVKVHSFVDAKPSQSLKKGRENCNQINNVINFTTCGDLTTCCVNYKQEPTFGNIKNKTIKEMWTSQEMETWVQTRLNNLCKNCSGLGHDAQKI